MRRSSRTRLPLGLFACCALLVGCGNSRTPVPSPSAPATPTALRELRFPAQGLALRVPADWSVNQGHGRLLATVGSGAAIVALWRFPRQAAPPASPAALRQAARSLVHAARSRDPGFDLLGFTLTRIGGLPAVKLAALEQINGHERRVSSSHIFAPGAEIVLEAYAPRAVFRSVSRAVFAPLRRSLTITRTT